MRPISRFLALFVAVIALVTASAPAYVFTFTRQGPDTWDSHPWSTPDAPDTTQFGGFDGIVGIGDVQILDPGGTLSDVMRFDNDLQYEVGFFWLYSKDGAGLPPPWLATVTLQMDWLPDGHFGVLYTPEPGQPGNLQYHLPHAITYEFICDVPEPATAMLLVLGALAALRRSRSGSR